ncbi:MAG: PH domain-containing protein [Candidatus Micrarchaeota archaeon]|nr:PH domain-containing protein [Candidatus Micrarchaeota archaeon]
MPLTIRPGPKGFYIRHYWGATLLSLLLIAGAALAFTSQSFELWVPGALVLAGLLLPAAGWAYALLYSSRTSLTLDGMEVIFQTGVISRKLTTVAVGQITDSTISQDLLDKLLGSARFKINTSGSTEYEIDEDGFEFAEAKSLHDQIYSLIDKKKPEAPSKDFQ